MRLTLELAGKRFKPRASCSAASARRRFVRGKPKRLINGKQADVTELAEEAGSIASQECSPTSDLRGSEQYKRVIVRTLVKRALAKANERAVGN